MKPTTSQKIVGTLMSVPVYGGIAFASALAIGWLASYIQIRWFPLLLVGLFGLIAGIGLSMWAVAEFKDRFTRFDCLVVVLLICGGWLAGINAAMMWFYPPQLAEPAPWISLCSVMGSIVGCAVLHRFRPEFLLGID